MTYNGEKKHGRVPGDPKLTTYGGYIYSNKNLIFAAKILCKVNCEDHNGRIKIFRFITIDV